MGLFDDSESGQETNDLLDKQIHENQAELEQKRSNLTRMRVEAEKTHGAPDWVGAGKKS